MSLPSPSRDIKTTAEISFSHKQPARHWFDLKAKAFDDDSVVSHDRNKAAEVTAEESDEDLLTVPDVEAQPPRKDSGKVSSSTEAGGSHDGNLVRRRRARNPVDKEYRRLKRLLRNRVSAQQARERKKAYVSDLESRARELQDMNAKLEEKISTLINENTMLRKVLMNTRPKAEEDSEKK